MVGSLRLTQVILAGLLAAGSLSAQTTGPDLLQETYRDWIVRCETPKAAEDAAAPSRRCEMVQELSQAESGQRVLTLVVQAVAEGGARLTLITPFGVRLSEGVAIDMGEERLLQLGFRTCLAQGCIASAALDRDAMDRLAGGTAASVRMTIDANGQPLAVETSLAGFDAAWARLTAVLAP